MPARRNRMARASGNSLSSGSQSSRYWRTILGHHGLGPFEDESAFEGAHPARGTRSAISHAKERGAGAFVAHEADGVVEVVEALF